MRCKEFVSVLEQEGLGPLPPVAQAHLATCDYCQNFLADLSSIVASAHQLPSEVEPPQRIWVSLRAQMEAEGLIKEPQEIVAIEPSASWLENLRSLFTPRALATAGVGAMLAIAAMLTLHRPHNSGVPIATVAQPQPQSDGKPQVQTPVAEPPVQPSTQATAQAQVQARLPQAHLRQPKPQTATPVVSSPSPSEEIYSAFPAGHLASGISQAELVSNPAVDEALRKNLRTVNEFIAECERHLKKHPQDTLAREYLNSAKQQKAELISAILDSGRSEQ